VSLPNDETTASDGRGAEGTCGGAGLTGRGDPWWAWCVVIGAAVTGAATGVYAPYARSVVERVLQGLFVAPPALEVPRLLDVWLHNVLGALEVWVAGLLTLGLLAVFWVFVWAANLGGLVAALHGLGLGTWQSVAYLSMPHGLLEVPAVLLLVQLSVRGSWHLLRRRLPVKQWAPRQAAGMGLVVFLFGVSASLEVYLNPAVQARVLSGGNGRMVCDVRTGPVRPYPDGYTWSADGGRVIWSDGRRLRVSVLATERSWMLFQATGEQLLSHPRVAPGGGLVAALGSEAGKTSVRWTLLIVPSTRGAARAVPVPAGFLVVGGPEWVAGADRVALLCRGPGDVQAALLEYSLIDGWLPCRTVGLRAIDLAISASGRVAVTAAVPGKRRILVSGAGWSTMRPVTPGPGDGVPSWSPDGGRIVFVRSASGDGPVSGQVWVADVTSGRLVGPLALADTGGPPAWSPDGGRILYTRFLRLFLLRLSPRDQQTAPVASPVGPSTVARAPAARPPSPTAPSRR